MHRTPPPPIPLVALAALAYVAGTFIGFAESRGLGLTVIALSAATIIVRGRLSDAGIVAVLVAGMAAASAAARDDRLCTRALRAQPLLAGSEWTAELEASAAPGAYTPARLRHGRCALKASIAVQRGEAPAGATVRLAGIATVRGSRIVVIKAAVTPVARPGLLARWRGASARAVDRVFPRDAPLAQALLLADMRAIPSDVKDRFAAAGLVHALSVSGLHVGIIAMAAELVLGVALGANAARVGTIALMSLYVLMVGAPPPAVRAAAMLGAVAGSRLLERPTTPWAALAIGAVLPLGDPRVVLDLGWQLSVVGVASLIIASRVNDYVFGSAKRWWTPIAATALTSAVASVASGPLVAYAIGRTSLIGPLANVAAGPLFTIAQPMLFLGLALAPLEPVARLVGDAVHVPLVILDWVARASAAVPFASITFHPTLPAATIAGIATAAVFAAGAMRNPRPAMAIACLATTLLVVGIPSPGHGRTEIHMLDVGQGDAVALRTREGRWVIFDTGRGWRGSDAARTVVLPHLRRYGGPVAALVLSHPHSDHIGGAVTLIDALRPAALYDGGYVEPSGTYRDVLLAAARRGVPWRRPVPGDSLVVDEAVLTFLAPDSQWVTSLHDPNDASLVVMVRIGARRILFMGDAELAEEEWLLRTHAGRLRADVLKVGHHGSRTSSSPALLDAVRPAAALISVGAGNDYRHPAPGTIDALEVAGAHILRTDLVGPIVVRTDGRELTIHADAETWHLPR